MTDGLIKQLRNKYRNDNNLDPKRGILSAVNGSIYDTNDPTSGMVYVRPKQAGGYGPATLVRGPIGTNIKLSPGMGVFLEKDEEGQLYISGMSFSALRADGVNPLAGNVNDPQTDKMIGQQSLVTLLAYSRGGTKFGIKGWQPEVGSTRYTYLGEQGDFTDYPTGTSTNLMPGAGLQCIACMAIKNDYTTSEIALSTAVPIGATITDTDLQEARNGLTAGSTPTAYWLLEETAKASIYADARQVINTQEGGGNVSGPTPPVVDNTLVRWDTSTGRKIQGGIATEDDSGNITATAYKLPAGTELTESSDAITITQGYHTVKAQTGTTDDLATINGGTGVMFVTLQAKSGHTITVKNGTGNIFLNGGADFALSGDKTLTLFYDGTNWADTGAGGSGGSGDVVGPSSAVDNDIAVFDSTTGKLIKDGGATISYIELLAASMDWMWA